MVPDRWQRRAECNRFRLGAAWLRWSAGWREHADGVSDEQRNDADWQVAAAEEVEAGRAPSLSRVLDISPSCLVSVEE